MLVNDGKMLVNDGEMLVNDVKCVYDHTLFSPSLTSVGVLTWLPTEAGDGLEEQD